MVLTRRAYKAISRWLPNEVITEIIQAASQKDRAALCRTSKLFYGLSVPVLYRVVDIETHVCLLSFSAVISSNPDLAKAVRSFTFLRLPPVAPCVNFPVFPRPHNFTLKTPRIQLLNLQKFEGPYELNPRMIAFNLREVMLGWEAEISINIEAIFIALKSMAHTDVPFMYSSFMFGNLHFPVLVDSISRNIPHTNSILLLLLGNPPPHNDFISLLRNCLPRFTDLTYLAVLFSGALGLDLKAEDQISLQQALDLCPTLEEYRLSAGRTWKKIQGTYECKDVNVPYYVASQHRNGL
ncbi:hypothetical protein C8R44DRAFT_946970 [Mycena epipterygia]|nr:hypothetical protein C8R44DRAFT_946970 [Mycena epipterygia]